MKKFNNQNDKKYVHPTVHNFTQIHVGILQRKAENIHSWRGNF